MTDLVTKMQSLMYPQMTDLKRIFKKLNGFIKNLNKMN